MRHAILPAFLPLLVTGNAHAHGGHLADVAGHSHWLGLAAAAAAAVIAAALAKSGAARKKNEAAPEPETDETARELPSA